MSERARTLLFLVGAAGLAALLCAGVWRLPPVGGADSAYANAVSTYSMPLRHTVNAVTAVTLDWRGFDTVNEEFILFTSVIGVTLLLREKREPEEVEAASGAREPKPPGTSSAMRVWTLGLVGPGVLLALYVVAHGHLSPGGGFQGGVVLSGAMVLVPLAGATLKLRHLEPQSLLDALEGLGAGGFVATGLLAFLFGQRYLTNVLPLGEAGALPSAGHLPLTNAFISLAVGAGVTLILYEFVEQTLARRKGGDE